MSSTNFLVGCAEAQNVGIMSATSVCFYSGASVFLRRRVLGL